MLGANANGFFPYTPATNLLQGLQVALDMLDEEGAGEVFARHERAARATRAAVEHWGFELQCANPGHHSPVLTAVRLPEGHSADALRAEIRERCNMSLGSGLGQLADRVLRIGHIGDFSVPETLGTIAAIEYGLRMAEVPHHPGGAEAAIAVLAKTHGSGAD